MTRPAAFAPGPGHHFAQGRCVRCGVLTRDVRVRLRCPANALYRFDDGPQGYFAFEE